MRRARGRRRRYEPTRICSAPRQHEGGHLRRRRHRALFVATTPFYACAILALPYYNGRHYDGFQCHYFDTPSGDGEDIDAISFPPAGLISRYASRKLRTARDNTIALPPICRLPESARASSRR